MLIWQLGDLFDAGFQFSFVAVTGLVMFSGRVTLGFQAGWEKLAGGPPRKWIIRALINYTAVNLVAFLMALPLVVCHFRIVTPLAVVLSLVALPIITLTLAVGYTKVRLGIGFPSLG